MKRDDRFVHILVNREDRRSGCARALYGAMGSRRAMGARIRDGDLRHYQESPTTYEIPLFLMGTLRGAAGEPP